MRIGIIGTGAMGTTHAQAWQKSPATVTGVVSKSFDSAQAFGRGWGAKPYSSLEEMLPHIDVLDICTPTHLHREMTLAAAAAGVHIICEKPLARTVAQAEEMLATCQAAGVKLLVAHVVRFFPEYALAQRHIAAGAIGEPAVIRLKRGGFQPKKPGDNWFVDLERSGGMMLDLMIHDFDFARWIGGEVETVYARSIRQEKLTDAVDHALVILTHANGTISHVEGSWAYPAPLFRTRFEIAGSHGLIQHDSDQMAAIVSHRHPLENDTDSRPDVPIPASPLHQDPYTVQLNAFYDHLTEDRPIPVIAEDGLAALKIGLAALKSAQTGLPVTLEEVT